MIHNSVGRQFDADVVLLKDYSRRIMKGEPILLIVDQALALLAQFQETAEH